MILAFDPGFSKPSAWALYADTEFSCGALYDVRRPLYFIDVQRVVIETPRAYENSQVRKEDVTNLARAAGELGGRAKQAGIRDVQYVYPQDWKGQVPKKIHHARVYAALTADEKTRWPTKGKGSEDIRDAICLVMWAAGRVGIGGIRK